MTSKRRNPGPKSRAAKNTRQSAFNNSTDRRKCNLGCCWRGPCPICNQPYPVGFNYISVLMRARPWTSEEGNTDPCALDLDPVIRGQRIARRAAITSRWRESRWAADPFVDTLRSSWETLAGAA